MTYSRVADDLEEYYQEVQLPDFKTVVASPSSTSTASPHEILTASTCGTEKKEVDVLAAKDSEIVKLERIAQKLND